MTVATLTHPDQVEEATEILRRLVRNDDDRRSVELRLLRADETATWTQLHITLLRGAEAQPLYFIAQIGDITERRRARQELATARENAVEASRLKSESWPV